MPKPIKVCHIAHGDLWAGAEVQLATLLETLVHDPAWTLSAILLNDGRLACEIGRLGIPVTVLSEDEHNSLVLFTKMIKLLKAQHPDIIHTHKYKDNILGASAAAAAGIEAVVRVVHGMTEPFSGKAYVKMMCYERVDRLVTSMKVRKVIAVSSSLKIILEELYGTNKVVQIHNGINLEKIKLSQDREQLRTALGIGTSDEVIGTVGRLTPVKGHHVLLRAANSLVRRRKNIKVLVVGDGPLMPEMRALAQDLGIEREVVLAGQRHDVYDLVNCMDVFALPSVHEGIPMVLLEALALKRPVVASRVGGIPEVMKHGISGLLVSPGSVPELEEGIEMLLRDKSYGSQLGQAGRARVEEEFSATIMATRTARLYASLVTPA